jgi:hypothetical protein
MGYTVFPTTIVSTTDENENRNFSGFASREIVMVVFISLALAQMFGFLFYSYYMNSRYYSNKKGK